MLHLRNVAFVVVGYHFFGPILLKSLLESPRILTKIESCYGRVNMNRENQAFCGKRIHSPDVAQLIS